MDLESQIVKAIRQIMRAVDLHSRRLVEACGLTGPQIALLQEAASSGPISPSRLARALHLSTPTVTGILNRLEKRGFVTRSPGVTDRRTITVRVTKPGQRVLAEAPSLLQDRLREELSRLEPWERSMALATLQRIASMMGAESLDAAPHLITGNDLERANGEPARRGPPRGTADTDDAPYRGR